MIKLGFKPCKPAAGFYITAVSLLFTVVAFIMYALTFNAFHYALDRWVTTLLIMSVWCYIVLLANTVFSGNKPCWTDIMYIIAAFALTLALIEFLIPCLSPIGIYFTVHNMGDVEANAIGVPRSIVTTVFFVLAIITLIISSFFRGAGRGKREVTK